MKKVNKKNTSKEIKEDLYAHKKGDVHPKSGDVKHKSENPKSAHVNPKSTHAHPKSTHVKATKRNQKLNLKNSEDYPYNPIIVKKAPKEAKKKKSESKKQPDITVKYDGSNEIDIEVLVKTLQNTSKTLRQISEIETGNEIDIKVQAFKKGSFEIPMLLSDPIVQTQVSLIAQSIPTVIETFKNMFELVKLFAGEKIKPGKYVGERNDKKQFEFANSKGNNTIIEVSNTDNSTKTDNSKHITKTENHYHGPVYNLTVGTIEKIYVDAAQSENVTGLKLLDENKKVIAEVKKQELIETARQIKVHELLAKKEVKPEKNKSVNKPGAVLAICKPDLSGKTRWNVAYEGNKIDVKIEDKDFLEAVKNKAYSFYNAARIKVDLLIHQELDEDSGIYLNTDYLVTKFHSLLDTPGQGKLFQGE